MFDKNSSNDNDKLGMNKKISAMMPEEIRSFMRPVGLPGLPLPMVMLEKNSQGLSDHRVGIVASAQNPFIIYSEQSMERVNGKLFRNMPTPSMMFFLRDMISRMGPDSENFLGAILGDASAGKTFLFYMLGELIHPQGAVKVDCGGMNMRELFFRTVIDYGNGIKDQLDMRAASGRMQQTSIDMLEDAFPGSTIQKNGSTVINWSAIGQRKTDAEGKCVEGYEEATARARAVLELIYTKEGIGVQNNSFGIKTVPGVIFEAWEAGRPLVLDEYNKSKPGTLDVFQTFLQFVNGEKGFDSITIFNPMSEADESGSSPKSVTLNRKDRKLGWFMGIAGNDTSDGSTTQDLSTSMMTRLNPVRVGAPTLHDWEHRLSQIYTGLPLTTLYTLFYEEAVNHPAEFADWLVSLRKLGLTADEVKAIPPHEIHLLQNFPETVAAMGKLAQYYNMRAELSNTESPIYTSSNTYENLSDEASEFSDRIHVSFRKAIADFNKALLATPTVVNAKNTKLSFDISALFRDFNIASVGDTEPGWYKLGANLARTIQEDIANDMVSMPHTHAALLKICEDNGVIAVKFDGARPSADFRTIADLLKYDNMEELGGAEELNDLRSVLIACAKDKYGAIVGSDEKIIPLASLGRALKSVEAPEEIGIVIPNGDIDRMTGSPLQDAIMAPSYYYEDEADPFETGEYELVDYRIAISSFAMPQYAEENKKKLWFPGMEAGPSNGADADPKADYGYAEILTGDSKFGFNFSVVEVADKDGNPAFLHVLEDRRSKMIEGADDKLLIVGTDKISSQLQQELANRGITYLVDNEKGFQKKVDDFMKSAAAIRAENQKMTKEESETLSSHIVLAFDALCLVKDEDRDIPAGTKLSDLMKSFDRSTKPNYYQRIGQKKVNFSNAAVKRNAI